MATNITLSTRIGYPVTYISSPQYRIAGWDGFISIDYSGETKMGIKATGLPVVTLTGVTVSAHYQEPKPVINIGDHVVIGNVEYELTSKRTRYIGNGDLKLVPVA